MTKFKVLLRVGTNGDDEDLASDSEAVFVEEEFENNSSDDGDLT